MPALSPPLPKELPEEREKLFPRIGVLTALEFAPVQRFNSRMVRDDLSGGDCGFGR
jgi:hypothetical protein